MVAVFPEHVIDRDMSAGIFAYFFIRVQRYWFRALRRRSQRHRMNWVRFSLLWSRFVPRILTQHEYPAERFDAKT